jgi:hypothetical protein
VHYQHGWVTHMHICHFLRIVHTRYVTNMHMRNFSKNVTPMHIPIKAILSGQHQAYSYTLFVHIYMRVYIASWLHS